MTGPLHFSTEAGKAVHPEFLQRQRVRAGDRIFFADTLLKEPT